MRITAAAIAAAVTVGLAPAAQATARPPAARDWTRTVVATPQGGFRMGNPGAKVKLVEYGSLACPHCRHFEETGYKPLVQGYVRTGRVSYEFRNFLLNAPDISVSLLAHCAGPAKFFPMSAMVFATQPQWFAKVAGLSEAQHDEIAKMPDAQRNIRLADVAGFVQIAARFGVTQARARQCLSDPKRLDRLISITKVASDNGVDRTPTFLINGKMSDSATWDQLEPELKASLGG
jgi:protein-disulfide isomerase